MRVCCILFLCLLTTQLLVVYSQSEVRDGSSSQDKHSTEITAIIVTAVMCGLGLILFCTGLCICCYIKCCTGEGCII